MKDLKWTDAIIKVLHEEQRPMHYTEIAQLVAERGYRKSLGATPQDTVSAQVSIDISRNGNDSTFIRIDKGIYALRNEFLNVAESLDIKDHITKENIERTSAINAFGIYWNRDFVHWKSSPNLLGIQQQGASEVNFKSQIGIYLLHDARETIYVGQAIAQTLGERLKQHTTDRLSGRWDRFSWFGFHPVKEDGELQMTKDSIELTLAEVGNLLEAILIESIEPRQNRKQGNQFYGIEYLQKEDEIIAKKKLEQNLRDLLSK
jgi:hypothetical protein